MGLISEAIIMRSLHGRYLFFFFLPRINPSYSFVLGVFMMISIFWLLLILIDKRKKDQLKRQVNKIYKTNK